jgi:hypothetical protein
MSNPLQILRVLDKNLSHKISLVIYGRGAIALGFANPPLETEQTGDVDGIIPMAQLDVLNHDDSFWESLEKTNREIEPQGLYMTHLFQEDQVILRPNWFEEKVRVPIDLTNIEVYRPATIDLILTKMMRGDDPQDMADLRFLIRAGGITKQLLSVAFSVAQVPEIEEIDAAFRKAQPIVLAMVEGDRLDGSR